MDKTVLVGVGAVVGGLLYVGVIGALIVWGLRWARKRMEARAATLSAALSGLGGKVVGLPSTRAFYGGPETDVELPDGTHLHVSAWYVSRDYVRHNLRLATPALPVMTLRREGLVARVSKALGVTREVQTGDADFDQKVFIHSTEPDDRVRAALASREVRVEVVRMLEAGCTLSLSQRGLEAWWITLALKTLNPEPIPGVAAALVKMAAALPRYPGLPVVVAPPTRRVPVVVAVGVGAAVLTGVAGGMVAAMGGRTVEPAAMSQAFMLGLVASVTAVAVLVARVRGRSDAHRWVLGGGLALLLGGTLAVMAGTLVINQVADGSEGQRLVLPLVRVVHQSKHTDLYVKSWRDGGGLERVMLRSGRSRDMQEGDLVAVYLHPGALGWPWFQAEPVAHAE